MYKIKKTFINKTEIFIMSTNNTIENNAQSANRNIDSIPDLDEKDVQSITKLQANIRGNKARKEKKEQEEAVNKIAAIQRGRKARKEKQEREEAVNKIAAIQRGRKARKEVQEVKDQTEAVNKIAAIQRGRKARIGKFFFFIPSYIHTNHYFNSNNKE